MTASSTSKINNHHSTITNPSLEKPRGQSLISPSPFASLRLCVRPKDPRQQPGPLMDADGPLMEGSHWCQAPLSDRAGMLAPDEFPE
jgi:hypothetical protein